MEVDMVVALRVSAAFIQNSKAKYSCKKKEPTSSNRKTVHGSNVIQDSLK